MCDRNLWRTRLRIVVAGHCFLSYLDGMAFIGSFGITVKGGLERCHRVKDRAVRNGWNRRRLVVAVANPISPSDTGVKAADGSDDLREAYRVWERCARALPDRKSVV